MNAVLSSRAPHYGDRTRPLVIAVGMALSCVLGAGLVLEPPLALLPLAALAGIALLGGAQFRVAIVVFGGMAVLGSSDGLSAPKIGYLLGSAVALGVAVLHLGARRRDVLHGSLRPLLRVMPLLVALVGLSLPVALGHGAPLTLWVRDVVPYLLVASAPVLALDARAGTSHRVLATMFVLAGGLAALSFGVEVLNRRGLGHLSLSRIALPSGELAASLFCYAAAGVLYGRKNRVGWLLVSGLVLSCFLVTGNRSSLLILVAPLAMVLARRPALGSRVTSIAVFLTALALVILALTNVAGRFGGVDVNRSQARLESVSQVFHQSSSDPSLKERSVETGVAWRDFKSAPIFGTGPGHLFIWRSFGGAPRATLNIDTPLGFVAKFGLVGVTVLGALGLAVVAFLKRTLRRVGWTVGSATLLGYVATQVVGLPLGLPFEDKGFAFGLLFLLALSHPEETAKTNVGVAA